MHLCWSLMAIAQGHNGCYRYVLFTEERVGLLHRGVIFLTTVMLNYLIIFHIFWSLYRPLDETRNDSVLHGQAVLLEPSQNEFDFRQVSGEQHWRLYVIKGTLQRQGSTSSSISVRDSDLGYRAIVYLRLNKYVTKTHPICICISWS